MPDRRIPIFLVLLLTIWIACSPSSSSARRVVDGATTSNAFDLFDYGAVFENSDIETDYFAENPPETDDIPQEAFLEAMQAATDTFNVLDFGAVGNGQADDTNAFLKAWSAVCGAAQDRGGIPTVVVPKGKKFLLNPLRFEGPCRARNVNFQIQGTIVAPKYFASWTDKDAWIQFSNVPGLIINGGGLIDGNGDSWWRNCDKNANCGPRPAALHIHKCDGLKMSRLTLVNSPRGHVSISGSTVVHIHSIAIWAPKESPNTDGIDISGSTNVNIQSSHIGTGDDCIAINSGSSFINITDVQCGPGHGISIGSLGQHGQYSTVEEVQVRNCSFVGTQNGVRIKTWEGGSGYARKIIFEGIKFTDVENPIIIDQHYSAYPMTYGGKEESKCVQVSDVIYRNVVGSSVDEKAINLDCAASGCTNIILDNVSIRPANPSKMTYAYCNNAHGTAISSMPYVPCLAH